MGNRSRAHFTAVLLRVFGRDGFERDELLLVSALLFLSVGSYQVWPPAAWLIPGAVLLWIALPMRRPFVERVQPPERPTRKVR